MQLPSLVTPSDLGPFPGAPFDPQLVYVAGAAVRAEAGWHIAPVITETIVVRSYGGCELVLPTIKLLSVTSAAGFITDLIPCVEGILYRAAGWPCGPVSVTMTHGFDSCPADLLPLLALRAASRDPAVRSEARTVGPFSNSVSFGDSNQLDRTIARYSVQVGIA